MKALQATWEWILVLAGFMVIMLTLQPTIGGDGEVRFASMQALMEGGSSFPKFSLVQPVLSVPLAWLADLWGTDRASFVAYFNLAVFGVFAALVYRELAARHSPQIGRTWLLLMMGASMFPHHLQNYYGEVLTSLCIFLAVLLVNRRPFAAALLFALGCTNTPALLPPLGGLAVAWFLIDRKIAPIAAVAVALVMACLEMWFKQAGLGQGYLSDGEHGFKTILPYSGEPGFSYPLVLGLLSIVISFGKGLVFFIPALFLGLSSRVRRAVGLDGKATLVAVVAFLLPVLLYSKWWAWYGGSFWGPRFFLFMCAPACLLLAVGLVTGAPERPGLTYILIIFLLSAWVALDGYVFGQADMGACWSDNYAHEYLCWYLPEFSALWRPFVTGRAWSLFSGDRWPYVVWILVVVLYLGSMLVGSQISTRRTLPNP